MEAVVATLEIGWLGLDAAGFAADPPAVSSD